MCCTKLSCLFDVVATKSWRSISRSSRTSRPSAPTMVRDDFRPKGGFERTTVARLDGGAMSESRTSTGLFPPSLPMPCSSRFMAARRAVPSTSSVPKTSVSSRCLRCGGV